MHVAYALLITLATLRCRYRWCRCRRFELIITPLLIWCCLRHLRHYCLLLTFITLSLLLFSLFRHITPYAITLIFSLYDATRYFMLYCRYAIIIFYWCLRAAIYADAIFAMTCHITTDYYWCLRLRLFSLMLTLLITLAADYAYAPRRHYAAIITPLPRLHWWCFAIFRLMLRYYAPFSLRRHAAARHYYERCWCHDYYDDAIILLFWWHYCYYLAFRRHIIFIDDYLPLRLLMLISPLRRHAPPWYDADATFMSCRHITPFFTILTLRHYYYLLLRRLRFIDALRWWWCFAIDTPLLMMLRFDMFHWWRRLSSRRCHYAITRHLLYFTPLIDALLLRASIFSRHWWCHLRLFDATTLLDITPMMLMKPLRHYFMVTLFSSPLLYAADDAITLRVCLRYYWLAMPLFFSYHLFYVFIILLITCRYDAVSPLFSPRRRLLLCRAIITLKIIDATPCHIFIIIAAFSFTIFIIDGHFSFITSFFTIDTPFRFIFIIRHFHYWHLPTLLIITTIAFAISMPPRHIIFDYWHCMMSFDLFFFFFFDYATLYWLRHYYLSFFIFSLRFHYYGRHLLIALRHLYYAIRLRITSYHLMPRRWLFRYAYYFSMLDAIISLCWCHFSHYYDDAAAIIDALPLRCWYWCHYIFIAIFTLITPHIMLFIMLASAIYAMMLIDTLMLMMLTLMARLLPRCRWWCHYACCALPIRWWCDTLFFSFSSDAYAITLFAYYITYAIATHTLTFAFSLRRVILPFIYATLFVDATKIISFHFMPIADADAIDDIIIWHYATPCRHCYYAIITICLFLRFITPFSPCLLIILLMMLTVCLLILRLLSLFTIFSFYRFLWPFTCHYAYTLRHITLMPYCCCYRYADYYWCHLMLLPHAYDYHISLFHAAAADAWLFFIFTLMLIIYAIIYYAIADYATPLCDADAATMLRAATCYFITPYYAITPHFIITFNIFIDAAIIMPFSSSLSLHYDITLRHYFLSLCHCFYLTFFTLRHFFSLCHYDLLLLHAATIHCFHCFHYRLMPHFDIGLHYDIITYFSLICLFFFCAFSLRYALHYYAIIITDYYYATLSLRRLIDYYYLRYYCYWLFTIIYAIIIYYWLCAIFMLMLPTLFDVYWLLMLTLLLRYYYAAYAYYISPFISLLISLLLMLYFIANIFRHLRFYYLFITVYAYWCHLFFIIDYFFHWLIICLFFIIDYWLRRFIWYAISFHWCHAVYLLPLMRLMLAYAVWYWCHLLMLLIFTLPLYFRHWCHTMMAIICFSTLDYYAIDILLLLRRLRRWCHIILLRLSLLMPLSFVIFDAIAFIYVYDICLLRHERALRYLRWYYYYYYWYWCAADIWHYIIIYYDYCFIIAILPLFTDAILRHYFRHTPCHILFITLFFAELRHAITPLFFDYGATCHWLRYYAITPYADVFHTPYYIIDYDMMLMALDYLRFSYYGLLTLRWCHWCYAISFTLLRYAVWCHYWYYYMPWCHFRCWCDDWWRYYCLMPWCAYAMLMPMLMIIITIFIDDYAADDMPWCYAVAAFSFLLLLRHYRLRFIFTPLVADAYDYWCLMLMMLTHLMLIIIFALIYLRWWLLRHCWCWCLFIIDDIAFSCHYFLRDADYAIIDVAMMLITWH